MSTASDVLLTTDLPGLKLRARGKVRDLYQLGNALLIVATDRISAFDYILQTGIPGKGRVLTQLSLFWYDFFRDIVHNHLRTADVSHYPDILQVHRAQLEGRSMLVKRAEMLPIECVARGYLSGSGWKDYQQTRVLCGIPLPAGLRESDRLPEPIFTPATKAEAGHDENIPFSEVVRMLGADMARRVRDLTLRLYNEAAAYAAGRGIIIADTKFEFGIVDDELVLADEVLTPDSSRFWPADLYEAGGPQPSYDKQYVRDYLESIQWNKQPPAPALPEEVVRLTSQKYRDAYRALTGREL